MGVCVKAPEVLLAMHLSIITLVHKPGMIHVFLCEENVHCCGKIKCILKLVCYAYLTAQSEKKVVLLILTLITFSISC